MRGARNNSLSRAGTLALALVMVVGLGPSDAKNRRPVPLSAGRYEKTDFVFARTPQGKDWLLTYRFQGLANKWYSVSCTIDREAAQRLFAAYGYDQAGKPAAVVARLQKAVTDEAAKKKLLFYGKAVVDPNTTVRWERVLDLPTRSERDAAYVENREFNDWYGKRGPALKAEVENSVDKELGFVRGRKGKLVPDYTGIAQRAAPSLQNCVRAINEVTGGSHELLVAFFQSMQFQEIEEWDKETGKRTGGLRVPTEVMIRSEGDCDSKALAFCIVQRARSTKVALFRSFSRGKGHALIGVKAYPPVPKGRPRHPEGKRRSDGSEWLSGVYEEPILIGNDYYTLCEVAGPTPVGCGNVVHGGFYFPIPI